MAESSNRLIPRVIIDLRCLQDPHYANRGIGQHARGFLMNRPENLGPVVGLIDPLLAMPAREVVERVDAIRPNAYFPALPPDAVFINPAPMTAEPLFTARLMLRPGIRRVAFIHDFIPLDHAGHYLASRKPRMEYVSMLAWLARYDLFLPNSKASQHRLHALLGARPSIVTGVALPDWCGPGAGGTAAHILAVAGDDPRKNPDVVIRAHASSVVLRERRIPLTVTGGYPPEKQEKFRQLAEQAGGDPALLLMPGHVTNEALSRQYRDAICVVIASRAEGFSLPVVEAMAAGVPAIASDIPPHAELVMDPGLRFHADDSETLRAILERIVLSTEHRAAIIGAQAGIWPAFTAKTVAAKIWSAIAARTIPDKVHIGGSKPRIAMLAAFPPARSDGTGYLAACAGALSAHAELALFSPWRNPEPVAGLRIAPLSALAHLMQNIDGVLSVLGKPASRAGILRLLARYGGAAICHDHALPDSADADAEARLLEVAARHAQPLILHSKAGLQWVRERFQADVHYLAPPIHTCPVEMADYAARLREILAL